MTPSAILGLVTLFAVLAFAVGVALGRRVEAARWQHRAQHPWPPIRSQAGFYVAMTEARYRELLTTNTRPQ